MPRSKKQDSEELDEEVLDTEDDAAEDKAEKSSKKTKKTEKASKKPDFSGLIKQVQEEKKIAYDFMKPKIDEWALRLKIYSNQKRDKSAIGDPLLFTVFQTVLASLYSDRLTVGFEGREEGDEETAANLNSLSEFDYDQMQKSITDYDWDFNTLFFGRALLINMEFNRDKMCPLPEVVDMMTWLRDPKAKSVNGDVRGRGAMRFGGREISLYKNEMRESEGLYFDFENLKASGSDPQSLIDLSERTRRAAQGFNEQNMQMTELSGDNSEVRALEWFTHWNGKKVIVTLASNCNKVIRYTELKRQGKPMKTWPIVDRVAYPMAQDWDGVSIPDLLEDKQRARSAIQNAALAGIKTGQQHVYLYDTNKIKNRGNLDINFNKHVPVDGSPSGAVQLIDRGQVKSEVNWILQVLDIAAQKATATPDIQQGAASGAAKTATESALISDKVDTRYSLTAKVWGWSEKEFWLQWYMLYKEHFEDDIDEKTIRISGSMGPTWRKLTRENIVSKVDPDVFVESKAVTETQNINTLQKYRLFLKDVLATDPTNANVRFALKKIGQLSGLKKDAVDQVLPPTVDELNSEEENLKLDKNEKVMVKVSDDDFMHMEMHNKAADTPAKYAHIRAHRRSMMIKRMNPELDMAKNGPEEPVEEANYGAPMMRPAPMPGGGGPGGPGGGPAPMMQPA